MHTEILCGDNLPILREMADNSVDAIVTDPPYGLSFMGKRWDYDVPSVELWAECLRVLKPGGHLLAFAGTRTQHRMAVRIEDAGFEIRDMIAWVYGSGFPKSLDVSKAIDRAAGAEREVVGSYTVGGTAAKGKHKGRAAAASDEGAAIGCTKELNITAPATPEAQQWDGWGTALKPALEPITLARKPLAERTVAANVLEWGTGGVNVDGCRVGHNGEKLSGGGTLDIHHGWGRSLCGRTNSAKAEQSGRFPANFIHDGSDEVVRLFPVTKTNSTGPNGVTKSGQSNAFGQYRGGPPNIYGNDTGSAARFFYCAKASRSEREAGLEGIEARNNMRVNAPRENEEAKHSTQLANHHPTVKPIALMRYLCRLVTPPGGIVLDPFTGSGTTGCAATLEGFGFIGIEREAEYAEIARRRIEHWRDVASQDETIIEDVQEKLFAEMV